MQAMLTDRIEKGIEALPDAREIRTSVFIEEQHFQDEFDTLDNTALILVVYADGKPAATGRVFPCTDDIGNAHTGVTPDITAHTYILGRIAALPEFRGRHLGRYVLGRLEEQAHLLGARYAWLHAQLAAQGFYEKCGYRVVGGTEMEEHCPHVAMLKELRV